MAARLARAPIPWREVAAALGILAMIAGFTWVMWARQPATGVRTHASARILKITYVPAYKSRPASASIEVAFADGHRGSVSMGYGHADRCEVGDTVDVVAVPTNVGQPELKIDPASCG